MSRCEHGLKAGECYVCISPKKGVYAPVTPLRTAAQQALEAWDDPMGAKDFCVAMDALRAALAQQAEAGEPVAKVIATAPKRIWLDLGFDPADEEITFDQLFEATWSQDNATGWGIEYVRADLAQQAEPTRSQQMVAATLTSPRGSLGEEV